MNRTEWSALAAHEINETDLKRVAVRLDDMERADA